MIINTILTTFGLILLLLEFELQKLAFGNDDKS